MIYKDVSITVNSTDLSSSLRGLTFSEGSKAEEAGAMGDNFESYERGVQVNAFSVQFWQDYSSGGVDATLSALQTTDSFTVVVLPTSDAVGTSNPSFTGSYFVESYERFTGEFGNKALCTVDFALASGTGPQRATA